MCALRDGQHTLWMHDPRTISTVIQVELDDSAALADLVKGKQHEGVVTDAEFALELYIQEMRACQDILEDRKMAQSIALAVHRDGRMIYESYQQEDQIARDRTLAMNPGSSGVEAEACSKSKPQVYADELEAEDAWLDDEMLEKIAALYNADVRISNDSSPSLGDENSDPQPESSTWASSRVTNSAPKMGHCVACGDTKDFFEVVRVPCNHEYCRECLESLFRAALKDESLFPPRCDGRPIHLNQVRFFLPSGLAREFENRREELTSRNRVYCHDPRCSTYIPWPDAIESTEGDWLACPQCGKTTCTICKAVAHTGDCPSDTALQQLVDTANRESWQRCFQCHRFVDLEQGCNHMTFVP